MKHWPFTLSGPDFLLLYSAAVIVAVGAWAMIRRPARGPVVRATAPGLDTFELAHLRGALPAVIDTALLALRRAGRIAEEGGRLRLVADAGICLEPRLYRGEPVELRAHPIEEAIVAALGRGPRTSRELAQDLAAEGDALTRRLVVGGWLTTAGRRLWTSALSRVPLALIAIVGVVRLRIGLVAERPVGGLVLLLLVTGALVVGLPSPGRRTTQGELALEGERARHDALLRTARTAPAQLDPEGAALAHALAGPMVPALAVPWLTASSSSSSSAACGGLGGGDGGGGDGGGGDGGGGCGAGCGGCGGCG